MFLYGAALSAVAAPASWLAARAGWVVSVDPLHFAAVGVGAFALGYVLVRGHPATLAWDPARRKGIAPRAFWTLCVGVAFRGGFGAPLDAASATFAAAASWAGILLEAGALAMLIYGAFLPVAPPSTPSAPPASPPSAPPVPPLVAPSSEPPPSP